MRSNSPQPSFEEVRCKVCRSLLFKASPGANGVVETKCKHCKQIRVITLPSKPASVNMVADAARALVT